jgi:WASH complex subunit strumpellin
LKRSIEYLQDYIGIAGLKMFQEELARVINYNTEQEANRYLKKKTFDSASRYQSKAIPIPRFASNPFSSSKQEVDSSGAVNFMGRVMSALLFLTDSTRTIYAPECSAWFTISDQKNATASEVCGMRTLGVLERALGAIGLRGLDRLLSFRAVFEFNAFLKFYDSDVYQFRPLLDSVRDSLFPEYRIIANASKTYANPMKKVEKLMLPLLKFIRRIGQGQLIRRHIANILQFGCELDAHLLYQALDTFNTSIMNEIRMHYHHPSKYQYPDKSNPLLFEVSLLTEACGMDDPLHKVYITSQPLEGLPVLLLLFLLTYLPKLEYDRNFGSLVRKKAAYPLDGLPLVVGMACLLKQYHPSVTKKLLAYLGQFVRTTIQQLFAEVDTKSVEIPIEVINTLIFMEQLCHYASVPRSVVHAFVPPYIFDSLRLPSSFTASK